MKPEITIIPSYKGELKSRMEKKATALVIKFFVQKVIFCPYTEAILDQDTAVMFELYDGKKVIESRISSPVMLCDIQAIVNNVPAKYKIKIFDKNKTYFNNYDSTGFPPSDDDYVLSSTEN